MTEGLPHRGNAICKNCGRPIHMDKGFSSMQYDWVHDGMIADLKSFFGTENCRFPSPKKGTIKNFKLI